MKNNKKTMNERTHNSFELYKHSRNTNSNTNNQGENRNVEFSADFDRDGSENKNNPQTDRRKS